MILIADSGSTKTDWCLVDGSVIMENIRTQGINPFFQSQNVIGEVLGTELMPRLKPYVKDVSSVFFYGSGCRPEMRPALIETLGGMFPNVVDVEADGDLLAAARALCGRAEGVACILGTGANSCLYDGSKIVMNTPPLGYILGDEGSGAVLGRNFINAVFKGGVSSVIRDEFLQSSGLSLAAIINKVYRQPLANRFLASLSHFIEEHLDDRDIHRLVVDNFRSFFRYNIIMYNRPDLSACFIGGIAYCFHNQLCEAAALEGFRVGRVERSPMAGLVAYHSIPQQ